MIYPLLWLVASSLRPTEVIFRTPGLWLNDLYVENYTEGLVFAVLPLRPIHHQLGSSW